MSAQIEPSRSGERLAPMLARRPGATAGQKSQITSGLPADGGPSRATAGGAAAIEMSSVSKTYRIRHGGVQPTRATEAIADRIRHPFKRSPRTESFAALTDISVSIPWGEAVGIVGRNGAGKSTLLKVLTRITAPSGGRIELGGRVGSLLEVGTGFHPELTGRENIYLNGTLLGMRRKEIQRRFDEIVAFSGVEKFLDTPVKRYSSGMYVRLAFSVAAHLETEILAIDEVLAVGDAEFQAKCLSKMQEVAEHGRTVLYVSHQVQTVMALCTSAIYLESGRLVLHGTVDDALAAYRDSFEKVSLSNQEADRRPGTGEIRFTAAAPAKDVFEPAGEKAIEFAVEGNLDSIGDYFVSCHVNDEHGMTVVQCDSRLVGFYLDPACEHRASLSFTTPWLKPGRYTVDLFACRSGVLDMWEGACQFEVMPLLPYPVATISEAIQNGVVFADFEYEEQ